MSGQETWETRDCSPVLCHYCLSMPSPDREMPMCIGEGSFLQSAHPCKR